MQKPDSPYIASTNRITKRGRRWRLHRRQVRRTNSLSDSQLAFGNEKIAAVRHLMRIIDLLMRAAPVLLTSRPRLKIGWDGGRSRGCISLACLWALLCVV